MDIYQKHFANKKGLEIGGRSAMFVNLVPIYGIIDSLDGCNFSTQTIWEGNITEGKTYKYFEDKIGHQYICEGSDLKAIPDEKYDFLISSHCLEHCANTLKTVKEWLRVIKKGGVLLMILPEKTHTFDHNRNVTTFEHLKEDLDNDVDETDLTHLEEILELHDLSMDLPAGTKEYFKIRSLDNYNNRCLHQHVFDFELLQNIYDYFNVEVIDKNLIIPYHQVIIGIK